MTDRLKSIYTSGAFWVGLAERAVKTAAQAALAFLATAGAGILEWDWLAVASITGGAVVLSVLTSLADPTRAANAETVAWVMPPPEPAAPSRDEKDPGFTLAPGYVPGDADIWHRRGEGRHARRDCVGGDCE